MNLSCVFFRQIRTREDLGFFFVFSAFSAGSQHTDLGVREEPD